MTHPLWDHDWPREIAVKAAHWRAIREARARRCSICRRALDQPDDADSLDCGGDCLACIRECERDDLPVVLGMDLAAGPDQSATVMVVRHPDGSLRYQLKPEPPPPQFIRTGSALARPMQWAIVALPFVLIAWGAGRVAGWW